MNHLLGELLLEQQGLCFWCGGGLVRPLTNSCGPDDATIDHLIPRWLGGDKRKSNIVAACRACNSDRGGFHQPDTPDPTGFDAWFESRMGYKPARFVEHEGRRLTVRSLVLRRLGRAA